MIQIYLLKVLNKLDVTDLLLYRGDKYKENKAKLLEKASQNKDKEWTFKPKLTTKKPASTKRIPKNIAPQSLSDVKYKINGDLEKYINPSSLKLENNDKKIINSQDKKLIP